METVRSMKSGGVELLCRPHIAVPAAAAAAVEFHKFYYFAINEISTRQRSFAYSLSTLVSLSVLQTSVSSVKVSTYIYTVCMYMCMYGM